MRLSFVFHFFFSVLGRPISGLRIRAYQHRLLLGHKFLGQAIVRLNFDLLQNEEEIVVDLQKRPTYPKVRRFVFVWRHPNNNNDRSFVCCCFFAWVK